MTQKTDAAHPLGEGEITYTKEGKFWYFIPKALLNRGVDKVHGRLSLEFWKSIKIKNNGTKETI